MTRYFILFCIQFVISFNLFSIEPEISLMDYDGIAITTDLEPDDVLALAILFQEANRMYDESELKKYPIDLVIVGEGNSTIKRMRMEKMLKDFFQVPDEVCIPVIEGRSTENNQFTQDGHELFEPNSVDQISFPHINDEQAAQALNHWNADLKNPLLILLKPSPEVFSIDQAAFTKTTALLYGSFNIRKTINYMNSQLPLQKKLEDFIQVLSNQFKQVFILETFGVMGEESQINTRYDWAKPVESYIRTSDKPFLNMFRTLSNNWNQYISQDFLESGLKMLSNLDQDNEIISQLKQELDAIIKSWDKEAFSLFYENLMKNNEIIVSCLQSDQIDKWKKFIRQMTIVKNMFEGIQFTLSDVLVSIALIEKGLFEVKPIKATYNNLGFLIPEDDQSSNVFYYQRVEHQKISEWLMKFLNGLPT